MKAHALLIAPIVLLAAPVLADGRMPAAPLANIQLDDPAQEARAKALMETVRCLVCQGQSIADSNADLAGDMRSLIRQRIRDGEQPDAIRAWLVQRYGNWVSYNPPLDRFTWLLWATPIALLIGGTLLARGSLRRRRR